MLKFNFILDTFKFNLEEKVSAETKWMCVCVFWNYISADQPIFIDCVAKMMKHPFFS